MAINAAAGFAVRAWCAVRLTVTGHALAVEGGLRLLRGALVGVVAGDTRQSAGGLSETPAARQHHASDARQLGLNGRAWVSDRHWGAMAGATELHDLRTGMLRRQHDGRRPA